MNTILVRTTLSIPSEMHAAICDEMESRGKSFAATLAELASEQLVLLEKLSEPVVIVRGKPPKDAD